jgi:hypothetical protein
LKIEKVRRLIELEQTKAPTSECWIQSSTSSIELN